MSKKQYLGDFSYKTSPQMDGLWDTITGAFDKAVDKGQEAIINGVSSGADKLLNDQIAKLLGTGGTTSGTTTTNGVTTTSVVLPGQTTTQTINQPMDQTTKYAIYGAVGLLGVMTLAMMFRSGGNSQPMYIPYPQQK